MGLEAARLALRTRPVPDFDALWFATADPAYLDKTNASAIHAALRLPSRVPAYDFGGSLRSGSGLLRTASHASGTIMTVFADHRDGLPTSADESHGGDGAAAILIGDDSPSHPVLAEFLGGASVTDEFLDRWRTPGDRRSRTWEERFGEDRYLALGHEGWEQALKETGFTSEQIPRVCITGMHSRAVQRLPGKLRLEKEVVVDDHTRDIGQTGTAHPGLMLTAWLEDEAFLRVAGEVPSGRLLALIHLSDGADIFILRTTEALADWAPRRTVKAQIAASTEVSYGKFLSWRGMTEVEPPRRPEPQRVSSTAAWRNEQWKFGFVGSQDRTSGVIQMPPARISMASGALDDMTPVEMVDREGTIVTFTIDRMVYSPSPPVVFAVVDFDGGGRFPLELTDADADTLAIGDRVEMTFRRLYSADGIHDYFWKATPVRAGTEVFG